MPDEPVPSLTPAQSSSAPEAWQAFESSLGRLRFVERVYLVWRLNTLVGKAATAGRFSPGALTIVAWLGGFVASEPNAPKEFYSASASAITTVLLALAVTVAWFRLEPLPNTLDWFRRELRMEDLMLHLTALADLEGWAWVRATIALVDQYVGEFTRTASHQVFRMAYGLMLLGSLLVGETFALFALMAPHPETSGSPRPVLAAVFAGLVGICLVALLGRREVTP